MRFCLLLPLRFPLFNPNQFINLIYIHKRYTQFSQKSTNKKTQMHKKHQLSDQVKDHIAQTINKQLCALMKLGLRYFNDSAFSHCISSKLKTEQKDCQNKTKTNSSFFVNPSKNQTDSEFESFSDYPLSCSSEYIQNRENNQLNSDQNSDQQFQFSSQDQQNNQSFVQSSKENIETNVKINSSNQYHSSYSGSSDELQNEVGSSPGSLDAVSTKNAITEQLNIQKYLNYDRLEETNSKNNHNLQESEFNVLSGCFGEIDESIQNNPVQVFQAAICQPQAQRQQCLLQNGQSIYTFMNESLSESKRQSKQLASKNSQQLLESAE